MATTDPPTPAAAIARLIIVSNRLPVTIKQDHPEDPTTFVPSVGGLLTGLDSLDSSMNRLWIGWPGLSAETDTEREFITVELQKQNLFPVFLTAPEVERFHDGFSNNTIWPLFHYFPQFVQYSQDLFECYRNVNQRFMAAIAENVREGDIVWIHDYQLMLVPGLLRDKFPSLSIGFFLHIPFPSFELFRSLPWRTEILNGILGADMIGFQTFDFMRHFLSAVYRLVGLDHTYGRLEVGGRAVKVDALPMGIDFEKYAAVPDAATVNISPEVQAIQESSAQLKLILSVDRLDYSKGIPGRIKAYETFLQRYPEYQKCVSLVVIVVPSRDAAHDFTYLKDEIELLVGRINGEFTLFDWVPIRYFHRSVPFENLCALYRNSQVALVTPLRDGMNLVAKEYVASKEQSKSGVLILSEMAGAAAELDDALLVNPCDHDEMAEAIRKAIEMDPAEQAERLGRMQRLLRQHDVKQWANQFINSQIQLKDLQEKRESPLLNTARISQLASQWRAAKTRLLMSNYGGTLRSQTRRPQDAAPDPRLLQILKALTDQEGTTVVISSGRDLPTLRKWFGHINIDLVAEFGACQHKNGAFQKNVTTDTGWKQLVRPMLDNLSQHTVGSFVEEKEYTVAWHYRNTEKQLGRHRLRGILEQLIYFTANNDLQVVEGDCVVEICHADVSKGRATMQWIQEKHWDIVVALGNDESDEDIFERLPVGAWTIKVGMSDTKAGHKARNVEQIRLLLTQLSQL
jgi:trehalose 6-phosphate synthase/phosphatase